MEPTTLLICILFATICYYCWTKRKLYEFSKTMQGPSILSTIGIIYHMCSSTEDFVNQLLIITNEFNKPEVPKGVWFGPVVILHLDTPEKLEVVLNHPGALRKSTFYKFYRKILGDGLFSIDSTTQWKHNRRLLSKTFNHKYLNNFVDVFSKHAEIFAKQLEEFDGKCEFNVFKYAHHMSVDVLCETVLGYDLKQQNSNVNIDIFNWINSGAVVFQRLYKPWLYFDVIYNKTKNGKLVNECTRKLQAFAQNLINEKRNEYMKKRNEVEYDDGNSLKSSLEVMIDVSLNEEHLSDKQMIDEVLTLLVAGSDSTAVTISFALMMLGMHQDIQDKVYGEMQEIFGNNERPVTFEDLPHMKYLEQIIKETSRLFSPAVVVARQACENIDANTFVIPKGTELGIPIYALHRNPMVWKDPLKFDPDRFSPENISKIHPYSYLAFSGGPRNCIAKNFAIMGLKCELATIIRKYKFFCKYKNVDDIRIKCDSVIGAVEGNLIWIEKRHH